MTSTFSFPKWILVVQKAVSKNIFQNLKMTSWKMFFKKLFLKIYFEKHFSKAKFVFRKYIYFKAISHAPNQFRILFSENYFQKMISRKNFNINCIPYTKSTSKTKNHSPPLSKMLIGSEKSAHHPRSCCHKTSDLQHQSSISIFCEG